MATSNILNIGKSALAAAQAGLSTTGHNIANANTAGYSRQVIVQGAAQAQNFGYGFVGQGTEINAVTRVFNELLAKQVTNSQSSSSQLSVYASQMRQIDNMLSDPSAGLSPAISDFFNSLQALSSNPGDAPTRQAVLSNAESLASRFRSLGDRLNEMRNGVNSQITTSVTMINSYAGQIAKLNDMISKAVSADGNPPNDLLDQRDLLVAELSKEIKTTVVKQDGTNYNIFIGNGLPLVVNTSTYSLTTLASPTDPSKLEVAYVTKGKISILGQDSLSGGTLGGLLQFRNNSLEPAQNQLGQIAVALAQTFNQQHQLGTDFNGAPGGNFFNVSAPSVTASVNNTGNASVSSSISNISALTSSDYRLQFDGSNYIVTRLSDGAKQSFATLPQTIDGVDFSLISGAMANGDDYLIRPTFSGAANFSVAISSINKIAAGGSGPSGPGDNRNSLLLAGLRTSSTMNNGTATYEGAFGQLVSAVGNKTRELQVTSQAEEQSLAQAIAAHEAESGVNLDEEATNLLRYQQAYQAAGKMMQIASQMFDMLLGLGQG